MNPVYQEISDTLGPEVAMGIYQMFKGQQISFPIRFYDRAAVHARIRREYDGKNVRELAARYEYSEKSIRRIVRKEEE